MKNWIIIFLILIIIAGGWRYYFNLKPEVIDVVPEKKNQIKEKESLIKLSSPKTNEFVKSPLVIAGEARGSWYFEGSFPISLVDANGKLLARAPAEAQGEWTTENFVPFRAGLKFDAPTTDTGFLILEKDNPSGLPQNADELKIPVKFR